MKSDNDLISASLEGGAAAAAGCVERLCSLRSGGRRAAARLPLSAALARWALLAPFYNAPAGRHHNPLNPLNLYPWPIRGMIESKEAGYDYGIHGTAWRDGLE